MPDYGLLGGIGDALRSGVGAYQDQSRYAADQKQKAQEDILKKRHLDIQEEEAAAKYYDLTGDYPESYKQKLQQKQMQMPEQPQETDPQLDEEEQPQEAKGLVSKPTGILPTGLLEAKRPGVPKRDREIQEKLAQLNAAAFGKGREFKYDNQKGFYAVPSALNDQEQTKLENEKLELQQKKKSLTDVKPDQAQSALFGKSMVQANEIFDKLEQQGYQRGTIKQGIESMLPGALQEDQYKQQEQAERHFVNAILRRESGAAISKSEFDSAEKQYFPRPGDSEEVLANKKANRLLAVEGLHLSAGDQAWNRLIIPKVKAKKKGSSMEAVASEGTPTKGTVESGYRFKGGDPADQSNWEKVK